MSHLRILLPNHPLKVAVLLVVALSAALFFAGSDSATTQASPPLDPIPSVTINAPAEVFIGDTFSFDVTFDNAAAVGPNNTGYGPFIDVYFPVNGADGAGNTNPPLDGLDFVGASYLGGSVISTTLTFPDAPLGVAPCGPTQSALNHPYAVDNTHTPLVMCGTPGDKVVSILLPFGSFAPDQPPATVTINAALSSLADIGTPLVLRARGGFEYGLDALDNWCCDPVILTDPGSSVNSWAPNAPVTPTLLTLTKTYNGPEDETATGPNFPRSYTVTVDIANGQTIANLSVTDFFDNNIIVTGVTSISPAGSVISPAGFPYGPVNAPANQVVVNFPSATNSASFDVQFYVPALDANGASILPPANGDDNFTENRASAIGQWTPLDGRDPVSPVVVNGTCPACPPLHTLEDQSIAIQKGVATVGGVPVRSGVTLEYTINFQVSDYFSFDQIIIDDIFSDGQRFDATFTPTLTVGDRVQSLVGSTFNATTVGAPTTCAAVAGGGFDAIIDTSQIGNDVNPATDGSTHVTFCVSQAMINNGLADGILQGGRTQGATAGPAQGTIVFRTVVQDSFSDTYPSGDASVDHGDVLTNDATIVGNVLDNTTLAPTGFNEADDTGASVTIARGGLTKDLIAVNGGAPSGSPALVSPGDVVTYRLRYEMPSSDFENFRLDDYLPLPVFDAAEVTTFNDIFSDTPAAGTANFGTGDTFRNRCFAVGGATCLPLVNGGAGGTTPDLTVDPGNNSLEFYFGDFDDPGNQDTFIEIVFSVTVSNEPFADGLFLTNQAHAQEGSTNAGDSVADDIVQIQLGEPVLEIRKGVINSDNTDSVYTVVPPVPAGFPAIGSDDLTPTAADSDLNDADARDTVRFAIVIENIGSSTGGAFDVEIRDVLPTGLAIPPGGINLQIQLGDGTVLASTPVGGTAIDPTGLFDNGLTIYNPSAPTGPVCQKYHPNDGSNIIIITYELVISPSVQPGDVITNGALLENYAGTSGGPNHLDDGSGGVQPKTDDATVTITGWTAPVKSVVQTSEAHTGMAPPARLVVGEIVRYRLQVEVPEATIPSFNIFDTLPAGLSLLDLNQVRLSFVSNVDMAASGLSPADNTAANNDAIPPTFVLPAANITVAGQDVTFNLGDLVNNDNDAASAEYVVIEFNALVLNTTDNNRGNNKVNSFVVRSGTTTLATSGTVTVRILEPVLITDKTPDGGTGYDAGDIVTFTVVVRNSGGTNTTTAFDVVWTDIIPATMTYVPGSLTHTAGLAPIAGSLNDSNPTTTGLTAAWTSMAVGENSTLQFQATLSYSLEPNQLVTNTSRIEWTSLPGAGTTSNLTGSTTPGASGDSNGERNGTGGVNDHWDTDPGTVRIDVPSAEKSILGTSEAHTSDDAALDGTTGNERPLAVGEIIRYQLRATIPEGTATNLRLIDVLPVGMQFFADTTATIEFQSDSGLNAVTNPALNAANAGPVSFYGGAAPLNGSLVTISGQDIIFGLGTMQNNDSDANDEYIIIRLNALVLNNASTNNGDILGNYFNVQHNGVIRATSPTVSAEIVEPVLTIDKQPDGATGDAGDTITFTITIAHDGTTSTADAFDVVWTDVIPAGMSYVPGSLTHTGGVAPDSSSDADPTGTGLTASWSGLALGQTSELQFQVTLQYSLEPSQQVVNNAVVTWTSLPGTGTSPNPTGSNTPGGSGAGTGERNGTGGVNDYSATDPGDATITNPTPVKVILTTSEAHTSDDAALDGTTGNERPLAIGEVIRYRLTTTIPEGTSTNFQLVDHLPTGFAFVPDAQATILFTSDSGIASSVAGLAAANGTTQALYGASAPFNGSLVGVAGTDVTFSLGTLQNNDSDGDAETVTIEFNALVLNTTDNNLGDLKSNTFEVLINAANRGTSLPVTARILEPALSVTKTRTSAATADGGDTVTYDITIASANTANNTTAFDVNVTDTLDARLNLVSVSTPASPAYYAESARTVTTGVGGSLDITFAELRPGDSVTFTVTASIDPGVIVGEIIPNTANIAWTSLPATGTSPNPTGSNTPGGSGADNGERDDSTAPAAPDDYAASDDAETITVGGTFSAEKSITATSEAHTDNSSLPNTGASNVPVAIGEVVRYRLATVLPEGTSADLVLQDQLANGVIPIFDATTEIFFTNNVAFTTSVAGLAGANSGVLDLFDAGGTPQIPGVVNYNSGTNFLEFALGDITNNDNDADAEYVVIDFNVLVINTSVTNLGDIWANDYDVLSDDASGTQQPRASSNTVNIVTQEPVLSVTKTRTSAATADGGDTVTYDITIANANAANNTTAFDVNVTDTLDARLNLVSVSTPASPAYYAESARTITTGAGGSLDITFTELRPGDSVTFTVTATVANTVNVGDVITNTANVTWTSLPGTGTGSNPTGSNTPGGSGADNGERDDSTAPAAPDDYAASDDAETITISGSYTAVKSIEATSETHTDDTPDGSAGNERPVTIGEVVRYQLAITIPEGTTPSVQLVDQLAAGIAPLFDPSMTVQFVSNNPVTPSTYAALGAANTAPFALFDAGGTPQVPGVVVYNAATNLLTFDLGDLVNNDNDADVETIIVRFNVVVVNSAVTNIGDIFANAYTLLVDSTIVATSNTVSVRVLEPAVTISKTALSVTGDAGDPITFEITVANPGGANVTTAFDVTVTDAVPAGMTYAPGTLVHTAGIVPASLVDGGAPTLTAIWSALAPGESSTIRFQAYLNVTLNPGDTVTNTASVVWSSLPGSGTSPNPTGSNTPGGSGAPNGERNGADGTGGVNDYFASDDAIVTVNDASVTKGIATTSEAHTLTATPEPLAIGEIVRYRLTVQVPEATSPTFTVIDNLPAGLQYLDDNTTMVAFVSDGAGITSSTLSGAGLGQTGNETSVNTITPTFVLPGSAISGGPFADGTDPTFALGTLVNDDGDANSEFVIIEFNALVLDNANNTNGAAKSNTFTLFINGTDRGTSNATDAQIVEPALTIQKTATPDVVIRGGTATFTITVAHAPTSTADAFDVLLTDTIPAGLTWAGNVTPVSGPVPTVDTTGLPVVTFSWASLPLGSTYTFTFDATVNTDVPSGTVMTNSVTLDYSSLPGSGTTPNPSGSTPSEERSYTGSDTATVTVPNVVITKTDAIAVDNDGDTTVDPGDTIRYTAVITNNTGLPVNNAVFSDTPGTYTTLVVGSVTTTQGSVTTGNTAGDTSVQVAIGTLANGASVTVTFDAIVDFPLANAITQVANQGAVDGDEIPSIPSDDPDTPTWDDETITPVTGAPEINVTKVDALQVDANGDSIVNSGDTLRYTVVIANTGGRDAENVVFNDTPDANTTLVVGSVTTTQGTVTTGNTAGDASVQVDVGLVPGAVGTVTITFDVLINTPLVPPTTIQVSNQGTATGGNFPAEPSDDPATPADDDPTITPLITSPIIVAQKVDALLVDTNGNTFADPGDTLRYTVTITNLGGVDATGVTFSDTPDANTTLVVGLVTTTQGTVTLGNTAGDTSVGVAIGTLAADGGTATVTFDVTINDPLPAGTTEVANQGVVEGTNFTDELTDDPATPTPNDPTVTPLGDAPTLVAEKVDALFIDVNGNGAAGPGDTLEYTITITNTGNADALNVVFTDAPDPNTTLVAGSVTTTQGTVTLGNTAGDLSVQVDLGTIPGSGGSATITFQVTINTVLPPGTTQVSNQGFVNGDNFPEVPTDDPDTPEPDDPTDTSGGGGGPEPEPGELVVTKVDSLWDDTPSGDGFPTEGDVLQYVIRITNTSTESAQDVVFTDTPDANTTLVVGSVTSTQGIVTTGNTAGDTSVAVNIGEIQPGITVEVIFNVAINSPLPAGTNFVANQGLVDGSNVPATPTDDPDTPVEDDDTITPLGPIPWLEAYKTVELTGDVNGDDQVDPGDMLTYTVTLTNMGNVDAVNFVFVDTPDPNTTLRVASVTVSDPTAIVSVDSSIRVDVAALAPGASIEVTFEVQVNNPLPAGVTQVANQGLSGADNAPVEPTDDPTTGPEDDPTVVPVVNPDQGGGEPEILVFDPAISKVGYLEEGDLGLPGERLTWVFTITNQGNGVGTDVVITDTIDAALRVDGAAIDVGSYSINGQTVTFYIPRLDPYQTVMAYVYTTVLVSPLDVDNTVTLSGNAPDGSTVTDSASAHVTGVSSLPSTGYEGDDSRSGDTSGIPWPLIGAGLGALSLVAMLGLVVVRHR